MTDRELLELAAKAAGIETGRAQEGRWFYCKHGQSGEAMYQVSGNLLEAWNPLIDDGDALRLAVRLGIYFALAAEQSHVVARIRNGVRSVWTEPIGNDVNAATRRAIVRAAAELGKAMP